MRFQSIPARPKANPYVLETLQTYRVPGSAVNPPRPQVFHLFSTVRGASIQARVASRATPCRRTLYSAPENALPPVMAPKIRARQKAEDASIIKIAWRFCYSRKPFRELCPRMRTPGRGQLEGHCIGCHRPPQGFTRQPRHTNTLLDPNVYTRLPVAMQGENQNNHARE